MIGNVNAVFTRFGDIGNIFDRSELVVRKTPAISTECEGIIAGTVGFFSCRITDTAGRPGAVLNIVVTRSIIVHNDLIRVDIPFSRKESVRAGILQHGYKILQNVGGRENIFNDLEIPGTLPLPAMQ